LAIRRVDGTGSLPVELAVEDGRYQRLANLRLQAGIFALAQMENPVSHNAPSSGPQEEPALVL